MTNIAIRIVANQKLSMTEDEWRMYQDICRSYDRPNFKGEDLFKDLFVSDDIGRIVLIKPPSKSYTSMEVFLFIISLFQQQHTRVMYDEITKLANEVRNKLKELDTHKS